MTELQELMLYASFGAVIGAFLAELLFIICEIAGKLRDKYRKHKEAKGSPTKGKAE